MKSSNQRLVLAGLAVLVAAGGVLLALAQPPPTEQKQGPIQPKQEEQAPYAMRVDVPVVGVDVVVASKNGDLIPGLRREHFRVYEDGVEQEIVAFAPTEAPLTTVLVVEANRAAGYILYQNIEYAYLFLNQLKQDDWVALVAYDLRPRIEVDFTRDRQQVVSALRRIQFGGFSESNMYDAIVDTLDRLSEVEGKKSIIVIGTGLDTFSKHTWDDARRAAREHRATIFAINTSWLLELRLDRAELRGVFTGPARLDINMARAQMGDLAEQTGGRAYFPRFETELPSIYREIGAMLRNQYSLAYRPKNFKRDGKYRKIEVKLMAPDGKPLKVIDQRNKEVKYEIYARKGYYAPES